MPVSKSPAARLLLKDMNENLEDEDVLEMINAGLLPWTVVDMYKANIWSKVFTDLKVREDIAVSDHGEIRLGDPQGQPEAQGGPRRLRQDPQGRHHLRQHLEEHLLQGRQDAEACL
ncbi:hypothetical protein [Sinorhizobium sp. Sb3]|uniref:hypothetical protein n=1 Tax=Sinorhizobium sp. Sb3 TaxID=1358417 RepID=UPI001FD99392|nr:hypothetical protein [Sinorhizobium sp. Sb3]